MATDTKRKTSFGTSMGVSSILAILVILVLVVFSTLSITTSEADLTLSKKSADSIQAFYAADCKAEDKLAEIASAISAGSNLETALKSEGFEVIPDNSGNYLIKYVISIDSNRNLDVEVLASQDGKITKKQWQVVPANEWNPDNSINLIPVNQ